MIINDLIYGEIRIENRTIKNIIKSKAFQRLKNIKQQGNTYFLLNHALQTRYSHSIGTYHLAKEILKNNKMLSTFTPYENTLALISALLHDIGHGPFSHCFEDITNITHSAWTNRILSEDKELLFCINDSGILLEDIINVILKQNKFPIIENILFSVLGADKLDYILRDYAYSNFYPHNFTLNRFINSIHYTSQNIIVPFNLEPELAKLSTMKYDLFFYGFGHKSIIYKDFLLKEILIRSKNLSLKSKELSSMELLKYFGLPIETWPLDIYLSLDDYVIHSLVSDILNISTSDELKYLCSCYMYKESYSSHKTDLKSYEIVRNLKYAYLNPYNSIKLYTNDLYLEPEVVSNVIKNNSFKILNSTSKVKIYLKY